MIMTYLDEIEFKKILSDTVKNAVQDQNATATLPIPPEQKQFLSRQETAKILGISLVTLDNYVKAGYLKSFRLGYKIRFRYCDILNGLTQINVGG